MGLQVVWMSLKAMMMLLSMHSFLNIVVDQVEGVVERAEQLLLVRLVVAHCFDVERILALLVSIPFKLLRVSWAWIERLLMSC